MNRRRNPKLLPLNEAVALIPDGATLVVGGSGSLLQVAETLLAAMERRFVVDGSPKDLEVFHVMGLGNQVDMGTNHLAHKGMVRRFIGSHFSLSPKQQAMIEGNQVEAIAVPAGTISQLFRESAAGRPGLITDIGIGTFVDPRQQWGRLNDATQEGLSQIITLGGREWLFYPAPKFDVALLRATAADLKGNLTMNDEAGLSDNLAIASAVHNSGGIVIAEVKQIVDEVLGSDVRVPGILVDAVVKTETPIQTPITEFEIRRTGRVRRRSVATEAMPFNYRKIIARRSAMELRRGDLINLGTGMANGISYIAAEEGFLDKIYFTVEQGLFGGLPGIGLDSGTALYPEAMIDMSATFDLYDGGGLDMTGLAFAQVDRLGNINVARVGGKPIGPGGFIDISQKAKRAVFCGSLTGGSLDVVTVNGHLEIRREGRYRKFVNEVDSITYNGQLAVTEGRLAIYVTERCVFELIEGGLRLTEVAPGIDVDCDIRPNVEFEFLVADEVAIMDERIFRPEPMGWTPPEEDQIAAL